MFRCENKGCNTITLSQQPENKIVLEKRPMTYENTIKRGKNKGTVQTTTGWEIIKEIRVCPDCYKEITGEEPRKFKPIEKKPVKTKHKNYLNEKKDHI